MPEIGLYLGDMTDELAKDYSEGLYIEEFVSGGPKNYTFKVYRFSFFFFSMLGLV